MKKIYIVDDQKEIADLLERVLIKENYDVKAFYDASSSIAAIEEACPDLVLLDVQMPGMDGMEALRILQKRVPAVRVIVMTAYAEMENAQYFLRNGAIDFIAKPFKLNDIRTVIAQVLSKEGLCHEDIIKKRGKIIGNSPEIRKNIDLALKVTNSDAPVLAVGESGTGKEMMVDFIHYNSIRKHSPLIKINCAAIPAELIESELFGYEKGAFTGAVISKMGKVEEAHMGTLFLDEICELDKSLQTKLLRILEYKTIERLGSNKPIHSDFRLICATNLNIEEEVWEGRFREDLYYRINTFTIELSPLRNRKEDIPSLIYHFIDLFRVDYVTPVKGIAAEALQIFINYPWPGNIRELKNVIQRVISTTTGAEITINDLPPYILSLERTRGKEPMDIMKYDCTLDELERNYILDILKKTNQNKKVAAGILGITEKTLYNKLQKYAEK